MDKIRILIVDDQTLMRQGLETILAMEEDFEIVGTAADGISGLEQARILKPKVILMDIRMPRMDGVECTKAILQEHPDCKIIILTTFDEDEYIVKALRYGARGYLLKDVPSDTLARAIRDSCAGVMLLQPHMATRLVHSLDSGSSGKNSALAMLTPRELELLELLSQGLSNREVASRLFITEGTVKNYLSVMYEKLGVKDRTQAVLLYARTRE